MLNKNYILLIAGVFIVILMGLAAPYTPPTLANVNFTLCADYTPPTMANVNFTLSLTESCGVALCSPTLDENWVITTAEICDGVEVDTGTGSVVITTGNLSLYNVANVTTSGLMINKSGEAGWIFSGHMEVM